MCLGKVVVFKVSFGEFEIGIRLIVGKYFDEGVFFDQLCRYDLIFFLIGRQFCFCNGFFLYFFCKGVYQICRIFYGYNFVFGQNGYLFVEFLYIFYDMGRKDNNDVFVDFV